MAHDRLGVEVASFALMSNHFHLLLYCPDGGLSRAMHLIESVHARRFNVRHGFEGPLFSGRFHNTPVTTDAQLLQTTRYIHRNPLDLGLESSLGDYPWSSFGAYLGLTHRPGWLNCDLVLGFVDYDSGRYRSYVETPMLSDKRVVVRPSSTEPTRHSTSAAPPLVDLLHLVRECCALDLSTVETPNGRPSPERDAMLVAGVELGIPTDELASTFGYASAAAVRGRLSRIRRHNDPETMALAAALKSALEPHIEGASSRAS